jgi:DNA-binding response OmpR family regulator
MADSGIQILLVESNPEISDLIAQQALGPLGYRVEVITDANLAIKQAIQVSPDVVIADLNLPEVSGKDLLVALTSQGVEAAFIALTEKGHEQDIIRAFRLGAEDYLLWPANETEIVAVVERVLKQKGEMRATHSQQRRLKAANQELQRKVRELSSVVELGKTLTAATDQKALFEKIVKGALQISEGDMGWLMLRDEDQKTYLLAGQQNLPSAWAEKVNQPLDDGLSSLVSVFGETLVMNGNPLQRLKVASLGKSAAVVPIKAAGEVIGLLTVLRKADQPFEHLEQTLLETLAEFAAPALVNARKFTSVEQTAKLATQGAQQQNTRLEDMREHLRSELKTALPALESLLNDGAQLSNQQRQALESVQTALQNLSRSTE